MVLQPRFDRDGGKENDAGKFSKPFFYFSSRAIIVALGLLAIYGVVYYFLSLCPLYDSISSKCSYPSNITIAAYFIVMLFGATILYFWGLKDAQSF
ncbi:hypothetical protein HY993_00355 [Candidatus Micrarchaeota archaeon]|nr:hypothetical protein [Candidatus Micrarchaeota archaeon]